ncbi:MAG TPA: hypothetical protein VFI25_04375 [Planctomycetota bacterium]|jgi:hypothetical protein|nr:hypothetical protein [Planctomycetota bacterium]
MARVVRERFTHPGRVREARPTDGRLSTVGHGEAFRAFCKAADRMGVRFLVIGGTYRDALVRAMSTRDIDVVLVDRDSLSREVMAEEGFRPVEGFPFSWHYLRGGKPVEVQVGAVASSRAAKGPFSTALAHAEEATIEGRKVLVPRIEDYVILKLLAVEADPRRSYRDLGDVQMVLEAFPELRSTRLSVQAIRARLRDPFGIPGPRLRAHTARFRAVHRVAAKPGEWSWG